MKKYLVHIIWAVVAIVLFVGGSFYGKSMAPAGFASRGGTFASSTRARFTGSRTGVGAGMGVVSGQILSLASSSFTVQLSNGNSQAVFYSSSTSVMKPTPAPVSALMAGTMVMIDGTENSDGSLTAQSIQVRPAGAE